MHYISPIERKVSCGYDSVLEEEKKSSLPSTHLQLVLAALSLCDGSSIFPYVLSSSSSFSIRVATQVGRGLKQDGMFHSIDTDWRGFALLF